MSEWKFLNQHRVRNGGNDPILSQYESEDSDGFNGMFRFVARGQHLLCIASDGFDWQHVSVSIEGHVMPPSWALMCLVKDLFWEPEDWVVQFHPARSQYVNNHPGCLHLWRWLGAPPMPTPPSVFVGLKT